VDSIPPHWVGGNIDDWRIGKGATMYYPVAVPWRAACPRATRTAPGRLRARGTAIECSLTGTFQLILHQARLAGRHAAQRASSTRCSRRRTSGCCTASAIRNTSPSSGPRRRVDIYSKSSVDLALRDAFRKMRHFLMTTRGLSEDEAISLMSIAVDFGVTQVVDGNWGVHAIIKKNLFAGTV
jgi:acetamidase/formamidase